MARLKTLVLALFVLAAGFVSAAGAGTGPAGESGTHAPGVPVYLFWSETCPHCAKAKSFIERLSAEDPGVELVSVEVSKSPANELAFAKLCQRFTIDPPAVPVVLIGEAVLVGYDDDTSTGTEIRDAISTCRQLTCANTGAVILSEAATGVGSQPAAPHELGEAKNGRPELPRTISIPGFGEVETRALSLPALTLLLGALDGFNPCAMWVLVFLIGLLAGMRDSFRKWSYGTIFLATSGVVYFLFMAAWLNAFLFLGSLHIIRYAIGIFAIAAGAYYLWQFVHNPEMACPVTSPGERQRVMTRLRTAVSEPSFVMGAAGLVVLAVGVNAIELLCSAGIPAIYTQVLAMNALSPAEHYAYLALYIAMFMLDDVLVFVTAMVTLEAAGLAGSYARYSHLIGGVVLGAIGLLLLFNPALLTFA